MKEKALTKKKTVRKVRVATPSAPVVEKVLVLRTCNADMTAHGGFQWPTSGAVEASAGHYSKSASAGDYSKSVQGGTSGIAAAIGNDVMAKAGPLGLIVLTYWSAAEKRYRAVVGNVGEDGIEADTWYRVVDGKLVKA